MADVPKNIVMDLMAAPAIDTGRLRRILSARGGMTTEELSEFKSSGINAFHCAVGFTGQHARETVKSWFSRIHQFLVRHQSSKIWTRRWIRVGSG